MSDEESATRLQVKQYVEELLEIVNQVDGPEKAREAKIIIDEALFDGRAYDTVHTLTAIYAHERKDRWKEIYRKKKQQWKQAKEQMQAEMQAIQAKTKCVEVGMPAAAVGLTCKEALQVFSQNETLELQRRVEELEKRVAELDKRLVFVLNRAAPSWW